MSREGPSQTPLTSEELRALCQLAEIGYLKARSSQLAVIDLAKGVDAILKLGGRADMPAGSESGEASDRNVTFHTPPPESES
jgi:hypothetical protein